MAERRVLFGDSLPAVLFQQRLDFAIGLLRINVVRADEVEAFAAELIDDPGHEIVELLVRHGPGVEAVLAALLRLVQGRVEQQAVVLLEHRQHRLAAGRGVAAEHGGDAILEQQLLRLFVEDLHHRLGILDDRLDRLAEHAALGVDLLDRQQLRVVQRALDDRDRAAQRVQDANLDRRAFLRLGDVAHEVVGGLGHGPGRGARDQRRRPLQKGASLERHRSASRGGFRRVETKNPTCPW